MICIYRSFSLVFSVNSESCHFPYLKKQFHLCSNGWYEGHLGHGLITSIWTEDMERDQEVSLAPDLFQGKLRKRDYVINKGAIYILKTQRDSDFDPCFC